MHILQKFRILVSTCNHMVEVARTFRYGAYMSRSEHEERKSVPDCRKKMIIEPMTHRELVRVHGDEVVPFLQGLITNDMSILQSGHQASMYTMFLNKSGRVLYDTIMYRTKQPTTYLIECDKTISNDFRRLLRMYRVRRNIQIDSVDGEYRSWFAFPENCADENEAIQIDQTNDNNENVFVTSDPRLRQLGNRLITPSDKSFKDIIKSLSRYGHFTPATNMRNYKNLRYSYGIAEGVKEIPPGKCFPLELNVDFLRGVSFDKGCYIGQELTARVHHTGVIRKRLMPLRLTAPIREEEPKVQTQAGASVGAIRGVNHDRALALLRVEPALSGSHLVIDGEPCYPERPKWWPEVLPERGTMVND